MLCWGGGGQSQGLSSLVFVGFLRDLGGYVLWLPQHWKVTSQNNLRLPVYWLIRSYYKSVRHYQQEGKKWRNQQQLGFQRAKKVSSWPLPVQTWWWELGKYQRFEIIYVTQRTGSLGDQNIPLLFAENPFTAFKCEKQDCPSAHKGLNLELRAGSTDHARNSLQKCQA